MNKLAKKGFYKPFFVSTGVVIPRPAPRRNTWRTQPLFLFGWALFPTMPENRTQGGGECEFELNRYLQPFWVVSYYSNIMSEQKSGVEPLQACSLIY